MITYFTNINIFDRFPKNNTIFTCFFFIFFQHINCQFLNILKTKRDINEQEFQIVWQIWTIFTRLKLSIPSARQIQVGQNNLAVKKLNRKTKQLSVKLPF